MGKSIKFYFLSEISCVIVPKLLVLESFDVSSFSGVMSRPSVEVFLSCSTKKIRRGTFCDVLQQISVTEKVEG